MKCLLFLIIAAILFASCKKHKDTFKVKYHTSTDVNDDTRIIYLDENGRKDTVQPGPKEFTYTFELDEWPKNHSLWLEIYSARANVTAYIMVNDSLFSYERAVFYSAMGN